MKPVIASLAAALAVSVAAPASAAVIPAAAFEPGHTLALGLAGLSYDYAWDDLSLGAALASDNFTANRMELAVRGLARFFQTPEIAAGVIAGVQYDPGIAGGRAYLVPDAGLAMAYTFQYITPITVMLNMTVTVNQYVTVDPLSPAPQANILQRLTIGPNSTIGAMVHLNDHMKVTVGGGTVLGARLTF